MNETMFSLSSLQCSHSHNCPSLVPLLKTPLYRIKISVSMFVRHSCGTLTQLERYGMRGLNTIKVLLDLLPLNL